MSLPSRVSYRDIPLYGRYEEALAFERVLGEGER